MGAHQTPVKLELDSIVRRFRSGFELRVDSLVVEPATTVALLGPSGSGKSSLLEIAGLLERPDGGRVLVDGVPRTVRDHAARMSMAAVFQRPYLMKASVFENVSYGLRLRRVARDEIGRRVEAALETVGLGGFGPRSAATLSGGEAQRVALARALVLEPRILLLDEPLASLDPILKRRMEQEFARILRSQGVTAVYVTHDPEEALAIADTVAVLRDGRVVASGETMHVMSAPADEWSAAFLGVEPGLHGRVVANEGGLLSIEAAGLHIAAIGDISTGTQVVAGVRPEDVVLFAGEAEVPASSARNVLAGRVVDMAQRGSTWHVGIDIGGQRVAASVSRASVAEMALEPGTGVIAVFKATAVQVRAVDGNEEQELR